MNAGGKELENAPIVMEGVSTMTLNILVVIIVEVMDKFNVISVMGKVIEVVVLVVVEGGKCRNSF